MARTRVAACAGDAAACAVCRICILYAQPHARTQHTPQRTQSQCATIRERVLRICVERRSAAATQQARARTLYGVSAACAAAARAAVRHTRYIGDASLQRRGIPRNMMLIFYTSFPPRAQTAGMTYAPQHELQQPRQDTGASEERRYGEIIRDVLAMRCRTDAAAAARREARVQPRHLRGAQSDCALQRRVGTRKYKWQAARLRCPCAKTAIFCAKAIAVQRTRSRACAPVSVRLRAQQGAACVASRQQECAAWQNAHL